MNLSDLPPGIRSWYRETSKDHSINPVIRDILKDCLCEARDWQGLLNLAGRRLLQQSTTLTNVLARLSTAAGARQVPKARRRKTQPRPP